ncbi:hypothetical protein ACQVP2_15295, partial [Methylobacterium aquaticum]|uniref:hypothetical protein n=1 Tax=Methylobacterium aquaticum TaxID=270351 RepID=UPI003D1854B4
GPPALASVTILTLTWPLSNAKLTSKLCRPRKKLQRNRDDPSSRDIVIIFMMVVEAPAWIRDRGLGRGGGRRDQCCGLTT